MSENLNESLQTDSGSNQDSKEPTLESALADAFKAAENTKTPEATGEPGAAKPSGNDTVEPVEKKADGEQQPASVEPPERWSQERKDAFKALAPEAQKILLDRHNEMEADYTKKTQGLSEQTKFYDELSPVLKQYEGHFRSHGITPTQAIPVLLSAQAALDRDPKDALQKIADTYGVKVNFDVPNEKFVDPEVAELKKELTALKGQLNQTTRTTQASNEAQVQKVISDFRNEKDSTGNLKYPHFEKVQENMGILINTDKSLTLSQAYDKAIRLDDELFSQTLKQRSDEAIKAREAESKKATEEAKKKQDGNIKGKNTPTPTAQPVTIEDNLRAAFNT